MEYELLIADAEKAIREHKRDKKIRRSRTNAKKQYEKLKRRKKLRLKDTPPNMILIFEQIMEKCLSFLEKCR